MTKDELIKELENLPDGAEVKLMTQDGLLDITEVGFIYERGGSFGDRYEPECIYLKAVLC